MTGFIDTSNWGEMYPDHLTIQAKGVGTVNAYGARSQGWSNVDGMVDLPCMIETFALRGSEESDGQAGEASPAPGEVATQTHTIYTQAYVAGITEKMQALDGNGQVYNILLSDRDPMSVQNILRVRKVTG